VKILLMVAPEENYMVASVHKSLDHKREHRPLLGILSVATFAQKHCPWIEVKFVDCRALELDFDQMEAEVQAFGPDVVGLTALTFNYYDTLLAARRVKKLDPDCKVVLGGWHVTLYPTETLAQDSIDYVVKGEGERTFAELLTALKDGTDLANIQGLGHKVDGEIVLNGDRPVETELDDIPFPDFGLTDISLYSHILGNYDITLPMESSRGCPYACNFCDIRRTRFRYRTPKLIVDHMEEWANKGIKSFFFVDDNVTVNKKRAVELFRHMVDRDLDVEFKISARVDGLSDEVIEWGKRAGVSRVSLGIESSNQKYLDYMQKEVTTDQIVDTIARARAADLPLFAFMMLGLPGQTRDEMLAEAEFLKRNKVEYANFSIMTMYPKTELYRVARENGDLTDDRDPWPRFAAEPGRNVQAPYANTLYTPEQLKKIQMDVTRRFYFSPRNLYRRVREVRSWSGFKRRTKMAMRFMGLEEIRLS